MPLADFGTDFGKGESPHHGIVLIIRDASRTTPKIIAQEARAIGAVKDSERGPAFVVRMPDLGIQTATIEDLRAFLRAD